jgi:hypothetical protein
MPVASPKCPKCESPMAEGFRLGFEHNAGQTNEQWIEGRPTPSFWTGVKTRGRTVLDVTTWRCAGCGFLDSYAK